MQANGNTIIKWLDGNDKRFLVPVYQRPYSWKKEHCIQLLKDLKDVCKYQYKSHFFGSIVYVVQNDGLCNNHIIIDGQQRLTTVSLLLLAIRNYVEEHADENIGINPKKISTYLTDEFADDEKKLKLKLVQDDDNVYNKLIVNKTVIIDNPVAINYEFFYDEISKMTPEKIKDIFMAVCKLDIVCISLEPQNGDDPQLIFESMNSTGKDLETSDKIRNYVLMGMEAKKQEKFYKDYWEPLEDKVERKDIDKFLRFYLDIKLHKNISESKMYTEFKNFCENGEETIEGILKDLLKYADFFRIIVNPGIIVDSKSPSNIVKYESKSELKSCVKILKRINKLDVKTCIPLMMDIFKANNDDLLLIEEMIKALEIIENYIVRREVCNLETNQLNKIFVSLGAEIEKDMEDSGISYFEAFKKEILKKTGKARFPNNHDFADRFVTYELYNAKPSMRKYILERLENYNTKEYVAVEELINDGTLTIEHIMPQTLTPDWKQCLGKEWELIHSKYKDTIGNLTLTAYNSDYSNSLFNKKKNLPDKGFSYSKLFLNSYVKSCEEWGEKQILERAKILFDISSKIWWMPETEWEENDEAEWIDWDEDYDFTDKMISMISVMGMVAKASSVADAYKKIHEILYDLEPSIYHNSKFSWFKTQKEDLKKPYEIGKNGYIETNRNNQQKIEYIKAVAKELEMSSEDIRFLVSSKNSFFDIEDENSYSNIKIGKLAFELFKDALKSGKISEEEVDNFKTKEYTKKVFNKTDYPILADSKDANKGNSKVIRYRVEPVKYKGKNIYVTTQWFEENRNELIKWYKNLCH